MFEMLKKSMLTGIGLALKTRDEVEELAKDWAKKQKLSEEEGRKFLDDLMDKYDSSVDKLEQKIEKSVKKVLSKTNIATRDELDDLKEQVALLRKAVNTRTDAPE